MMKILLTGHAGSYNRGCEAIVRCTIDIIRRYLGPTDITILSFDPASDRSAMLSQLENVRIKDILSPIPQKYSLGWLVKGIERRILRRAFPGIPSYFSYVNRFYYQGTDVVISVGGDNFSDYYGGPGQFFGELTLARLLSSRTVIWGASIGPFHDKKLEKRWAHLLRKVDLITVRESTSVKYLHRIGVAENVRQVADLAFLLPAHTEGATSLSSLRAETIVGIGMSALISKYGLDQDKYINAFTALAKHILSDANTHLVLIPHVIGKSMSNNDQMVCEQLVGRLACSDRVTLVDQKHNACQMKHVISQCDYFIGARTHSTIASLSSYVPTLSIGYSTKAYGINEDIFGHTDYVLPISDLAEKSLMKKFILLCNNRHEIVKQLKRRLPAIENMAERSGEYLAEIVTAE